MKISERGLQFIANNEGLRLKAYDDAQPSKSITSLTQVKGTLTIGYGHTKGVYPEQSISKEQALEFLRQDVVYFEDIVTKKVKVDLNQNQFDALVDFCFNIGEGNFGKSNLLKSLNSGDYHAAAEGFFGWTKPISIKGRRILENQLFLDGIGVLSPISPTVKNVGNDIAAIIFGGLLLFA